MDFESLHKKFKDMQLQAAYNTGYTDATNESTPIIAAGIHKEIHDAVIARISELKQRNYPNAATDEIQLEVRALELADEIVDKTIKEYLKSSETER